MAQISRYTRKMVAEAVSTIYGRLASGKSDKEVQEEMGLSASEYNELKAAMFDQESENLRRRPVEHVYVDYMMKQAENVRDLSAMIAEFKRSKQYSAMVGAVRARSEIYDKLIDRGQSFGLIHRQPERKEVVNGVIVTELSNKELRSMITSELAVLEKLMSKYGDQSIIDMDPRQLAVHNATDPSPEASPEPHPESAPPHPTPPPPPKKPTGGTIRHAKRPKNNGKKRISLGPVPL